MNGRSEYVDRYIKKTITGHLNMAYRIWSTDFDLKNKISYINKCFKILAIHKMISQ